MGYYDALVAKWSDVAGATSAEKIANLNAEIVAGPRVDVTISAVVGFMILSGAYLSVASFAQSAGNGTPVHDNALMAAKSFMTVVTVPNAPNFNTSNPANYAIIKGMMDAMLAQEVAVPGSTGFVQTVHDGLLALAETTMPWWLANGYTSPFTQADLDAAGGLA